MSIKKRSLVFDNNLGLIRTASDVVIKGFAGVWKPNTVYAKDDIVIVYGQSNIGYKSLIDSNQNDPVADINHLYWAVINVETGEDAVLSLADKGGIRIGSGEYLDPKNGMIAGDPNVYPMDGVLRVVKDATSGAPKLQVANQGVWSNLAEPIDEQLLMIYAIIFSN